MTGGAHREGERNGCWKLLEDSGASGVQTGREQETSGQGDEKEWRPEAGERRRESAELHSLMLSGGHLNNGHKFVIE